MPGSANRLKTTYRLDIQLSPIVFLVLHQRGKQWVLCDVQRQQRLRDSILSITTNTVALLRSWRPARRRYRITPDLIYIQARLLNRAPQEAVAEEPRLIRPDLVLHKLSHPRRKDEGKILEGPALRFFHEKEYGDEDKEIEPCENAKCADNTAVVRLILVPPGRMKLSRDLQE